MHLPVPPPQSQQHLHQPDSEHLVYRNPEPARRTAPGALPAALVLTPLELIDKIAALMPPPRAHRHRYYGVLTPNAPLRSVVTAQAPAAAAPAFCVPAMRFAGRHLLRRPARTPSSCFGPASVGIN
ncbi:MAG: transposase [Sulfuritalea sp.]|nr:transposase [Sulfuritalea sp.]